MSRLYADENFPITVVRLLRQLGHDVLTVRQAGKDNDHVPDDEVLAYATRDGRAVLTQNRRHYFALDRQGVRHAGIIACTEDHDRAGQAARIDAALRPHPDLAGLVLRVYKPSK